MRSITFAALLGLAAMAAPAAERKQLNCDSRGSHGHLETWCEMREQTVAFTGGTVSVDARPNGGISVNGWDQAQVLVRARVEGAATTLDQAKALVRQIQVETAGTQIRSNGPANAQDQYWSVSYEVFVPRHAAVDLHSTNGGIRVAETTGRVEFQTRNGGVSLARVSGNVHGHTTNGGVHIELAGDRWQGEGLDVTTTNGGVHIAVPENYSAHLELGTTNGGVHVDFPVTTQGEVKHRLSTDLGSGGATLRAITTNGGVHVSRIQS